MSEWNLSEKNKCLIEGHATKHNYYVEKDIKEKIQNAQKRLKEEWDKWTDEDTIGKKPLYTDFLDEMDKIFLEEFGDKLC